MNNATDREQFDGDYYKLTLHSLDNLSALWKLGSDVR